MNAPKLPLGGQFCEEIESQDGLSVGDRITFMSALWDSRGDVAVTGIIRVLYLEKHPNTLSWRPEGAVFAEVDLLDGGQERCWFTRDKPALAREIDGSVGAVPEGAMF